MSIDEKWSRKIKSLKMDRVFRDPLTNAVIGEQIISTKNLDIAVMLARM